METVRIVFTVIGAATFVLCAKGIYTILTNEFLQFKEEGREYHNMFD